MELKLYFVWVILFVPIMPMGIFTMLVARLVESHTDLGKLLFARRRIFPQRDEVARNSQIALGWCAISIGVAWSLALSFLTYNNEIWKWSREAQAAARATFWAWCFASCGAMIIRRELRQKPHKIVVPIGISGMLGLLMYLMLVKGASKL
jgi:hypothetical protein